MILSGSIDVAEYFPWVALPLSPGYMLGTVAGRGQPGEMSKVSVRDLPAAVSLSHVRPAYRVSRLMCPANGWLNRQVWRISRVDVPMAERLVGFRYYQNLHRTVVEAGLRASNRLVVCRAGQLGGSRHKPCAAANIAYLRL